MVPIGYPVVIRMPMAVDHVDHEQRHERVDHGFVDCVSRGLGAAAGDAQSAVTRDQPGDESEECRFHTRDDDLGHSGQQRDTGGESAWVHILDEDREEVASRIPMTTSKAVEQQRN